VNLSACAVGLAFWVAAASLGIAFGRRAGRPGPAFLRGVATVYLAVGVVSAVTITIMAFVVNSWPPPWHMLGLVLGLLLFGLPPALVAGAVSAVTVSRQRRQEGSLLLNPDVERVAREYFNPAGKPGDQGAIRQADEDVREDGGS